MKPEMITHTLQSLERELGQGKKYSPEQAKKIRDSLINEPDKAMASSYDWWILNANYLPPPQKLIESVKMEAAKFREKSAAEDKKKYESPPAAINRDFQKRCMEILLLFFPDEPNEADYKTILGKVKEVAIRYPLSDFPNIYTEFEKKWTSQGKI